MKALTCFEQTGLLWMTQTRSWRARYSHKDSWKKKKAPYHPLCITPHILCGQLSSIHPLAPRVGKRKKTLSCFLGLLAPQSSRQGSSISCTPSPSPSPSLFPSPSRAGQWGVKRVIKAQFATVTWLHARRPQSGTIHQKQPRRPTDGKIHKEIGKMEVFVTRRCHLWPLGFMQFQR